MLSQDEEDGKVTLVQSNEIERNEVTCSPDYYQSEVESGSFMVVV